MPDAQASRSHADALIRLVTGRKRVLIFTHDNPDPDSMAAALCLSYLIESVGGVHSRIVYGGIVGRAENRSMVQLLEIPLWSLESLRLRPDDAVIMVDTQPGFANNSLPEGRAVLAVLDHHRGGPLPDVPLCDMRTGYGAVTTIATEYLLAAGVEIPPRLATAICYGISSETQDLGREAAPEDIAAFLAVYPRCDQPLLGRLRHPRRPASFFVELADAIRAVRAGDGVAVCHLGGVATPDVAAEMADMLISIENLEWVMVTAPYGDRLILSVRTNRGDAHAGELLRGVVGERHRAGGHGMIAGGSVRLPRGSDPAPTQHDLEERFLSALGHPGPSALKPLEKQPGVRAPDGKAPRKS